MEELKEKSLTKKESFDKYTSVPVPKGGSTGLTERSIPFEKEKEFELYRLFYFMPEKFYRRFVSPEYESFLRWLVKYFDDRRLKTLTHNDNLWKERLFKAGKIQVVSVSDPETVFLHYLETQRPEHFKVACFAVADYRVGSALGIDRPRMKEIRKKYRDSLKVQGGPDQSYVHPYQETQV